MANKENNKGTTNGMQLGEISTIRDILMGEQIGEYHARFKAIDEQIAKLAETLHHKIDALEEQQQSAMDTMEHNTQTQFNKLEQLIEANFVKLQDKLEKVSRDDKMRLGKMLDKVSKQLMGE